MLAFGFIYISDLIRYDIDTSVFVQAVYYSSSYSILIPVTFSTSSCSNGSRSSLESRVQAHIGGSLSTRYSKRLGPLSNRSSRIKMMYEKMFLYFFRVPVDAAYLSGEDHHICLFGVCLLITHWPWLPSVTLSTPDCTGNTSDSIQRTVSLITISRTLRTHRVLYFYVVQVVVQSLYRVLYPLNRRVCDGVEIGLGRKNAEASA